MKTILAIDDQQDNLTTIKAVIKAHIPNCEVITALSGKEGIEVAQQEQPDAILLDIIMPQMDGYETCKRLKESELTKHIPVIMVTAIRTDSESRVKGLDMGADAFLSKPIDPIELSAQVRVMLRIKDAEDKLRAEKESLEETVLKRTLELQVSEEKYKALYDNAPLSYQSLDENGCFLDINPAWLSTLGYEREEVIGKCYADFLHPDMIPHFKKNFPAFKKRGYVSDVQFKIRHKDGHFLDISFEGCIGYNPDGSFKQTYCVFQDITESKLAKENLVAALEKATESDRLKSAFLANISHEIRTPMNGILGFSSLLREPKLSGEKQNKYVDIIEKSGARMLNIINNLVDISKIEAGLMNITISSININKEIDELFKFFKPEVTKKDMKLILNKALPDSKAVLETDKQKLNSILINLLKNAIKYTDAGNIEFGYELGSEAGNTGESSSGSLSRNEVIFYIKDTGIGIPENRQQAIFDRFVQADIEDRDAREGSGLGLSISKAYVDLLGGKIWLNSVPQKGTEFYFTIPYNITHNLEPEKSLSTGDKDAETLLNKLNILIVEDEEYADVFLTELVKDMSNKIYHAKNGREGVEMAKSNPDIDLILMDIKMHNMNGLEATKKIRQFNKEVAIIAQTAYAMTGDRDLAIKAGCDDYISKPIEPTLLFTKIKALLEN